MFPVGSRVRAYETPPTLVQTPGAGSDHIENLDASGCFLPLPVQGFDFLLLLALVRGVWRREGEGVGGFGGDEVRVVRGLLNHGGKQSVEEVGKGRVETAVALSVGNQHSNQAHLGEEERKKTVQPSNIKKVILP